MLETVNRNPNTHSGDNIGLTDRFDLSIIFLFIITFPVHFQLDLQCVTIELDT